MNGYPAVLYVEDDALSREVIQTTLRFEMQLQHIAIFEDSADFVARVQALDPKPDIVLLDIHVRPLNGFEMLDALRQMDGFQQIPVAALTASVMNEEVQRLRDAGFNGVIAKPVDQDLLPEILNRLLRGEIIWRIAE